MNPFPTHTPSFAVGRGLAPGKMPGILPVPQRAAEGGGPYECTVEPVVGDGALDVPAEPVRTHRRTHANTHTPHHTSSLPPRRECIYAFRNAPAERMNPFPACTPETPANLSVPNHGPPGAAEPVYIQRRTYANTHTPARLTCHSSHPVGNAFMHSETHPRNG